MKVVILSFFVTTLYLLSVSFPEAEAVKKPQKNCKNPKGEHGSFNTAVCIKSTCLKGKWKTEINKAICCHERIAYKPNEIISKSSAEDGCTVLTIECKKEGNMAKTVVKHKYNCSKPSSEDQVEVLSAKIDNLKQLMVNHIATTTTTTTYTVPLAGILIAGGESNPRAVELFLPETGKTCNLAPLPENRYYFTMDSVDNTGTVIACGGESTKTSCIKFTPTSAGGTWTSHSTTQEDRYLHDSWVSPSGLLLLGGRGSSTTSEFVGGGMNITMPDTGFGCSIDDSTSIIITGGYPHKRMAARFNLQGKVEDFPDLQVSRYDHGCGTYKSGESKIIVVAGGYDGYRIRSTETLVLGSSSWTFGEALPWALDRLSSISLEHEILLFGIFVLCSYIMYYQLVLAGGQWHVLPCNQANLAAAINGVIFLSVISFLALYFSPTRRCYIWSDRFEWFG